MSNPTNVGKEAKQCALEFAQGYITQLCCALEGISLGEVEQVIKVLEKIYNQGRCVFLAGNGGSAATASHMANDLSKTVPGENKQIKGFRAISLSDNIPLITAWANDVSYEEIFAGQLSSLGEAGDAIILISGSGNSPNLLRAASAARELSMSVIGFLGCDGGKLKALCDVSIIVPHDDYGPIEDAHMALDHLITAYFHNRLKNCTE